MYQSASTALVFYLERTLRCPTGTEFLPWSFTGIPYQLRNRYPAFNKYYDVPHQAVADLSRKLDTFASRVETHLAELDVRLEGLEQERSLPLACSCSGRIDTVSAKVKQHKIRQKKKRTSLVFCKGEDRRTVSPSSSCVFFVT